ncbi:DNA repair protein RecO [Candidatus Nomurabacteria bacterium]|nr:DNA repair protein RecO [Candidatus Nomurabacteria bacterium]
MTNTDLKSKTYGADEALVLKKTRLKDTHNIVTLFSKSFGKMKLTSFGSRSLKSRKLSHLETGNVITFSWVEQGEYKTLSETELQYGHSGIKEDEEKLNTMFMILYILNRLLPENEPENQVYSHTLKFFRALQKAPQSMQEIEVFLKGILLDLGFVDDSEVAKSTFNPMDFIEGLIGQKIRIGEWA